MKRMGRDLCRIEGDSHWDALDDLDPVTLLHPGLEVMRRRYRFPDPGR